MPKPDRFQASWLNFPIVHAQQLRMLPGCTEKHICKYSMLLLNAVTCSRGDLKKNEHDYQFACSLCELHVLGALWHLNPNLRNKRRRKKIMSQTSQQNTFANSRNRYSLESQFVHKFHEFAGDSLHSTRHHEETVLICNTAQHFTGSTIPK